MREKVSPVVRKIEKEEEEVAEEILEEEVRTVTRLLEEEMATMITEDEEVAKRELKILAGLKKMIEVETEHEEILQTKIVSPYEVQGQWTEWEEAAKEEIRSLLEEKEALRQITKNEFEEMKEETQRGGRRIEVIPSKVVFTRKPGPKGGKTEGEMGGLRKLRGEERRGGYLLVWSRLHGDESDDPFGSSTPMDRRSPGREDGVLER